MMSIAYYIDIRDRGLFQRLNVGDLTKTLNIEATIAEES